MKYNLKSFRISVVNDKVSQNNKYHKNKNAKIYQNELLKLNPLRQFITLHQCEGTLLKMAKTPDFISKITWN